MSPELHRWSVALPKGSNAFAEAIGVPARKLLVEAAGVVADWEVDLFFNYPWPMSFEPTERRRAVLTGHSLSADRPLPFLAARFVLRRCSAVGVCSTGVTLQCSERQVQQKPRQ